MRAAIMGNFKRMMFNSIVFVPREEMKRKQTEYLKNRFKHLE